MYHIHTLRHMYHVSLWSRGCLPFRSPWVFSGVRVARSLVLYVCFVDRCLSFCTFSFDHCVVCSSSIYGFRLPLWYLQTPLRSRYYRLLWNTTLSSRLMGMNLRFECILYSCLILSLFTSWYIYVSPFWWYILLPSRFIRHSPN